eukprot:2081184-Pleurochrysis_carterae.AAC.2
MHDTDDDAHRRWLRDRRSFSQRRQVPVPSRPRPPTHFFRFCRVDAVHEIAGSAPPSPGFGSSEGRGQRSPGPSRESSRNEPASTHALM